MRIIAGSLKGRRLPKVGNATRPTKELVRGALFNRLAPRIEGCRFLDLFAGTGAVGLEALSRGASQVVLVERSAAALKENVAALGVADQVEVCVAEGLRWVRQCTRQFDIIFADPPYDQTELAELIAGCRKLLAEGGLLVIQQAAKTPVVDGSIDQRRYGECLLVHYV